MTIKENIKQFEKLLGKCHNHPIGGLLEYDGKDYFFRFHCEVLGLGGVRSHVVGAKTEALRLLLTSLDKYYNKVNGHSSFHSHYNSFQL